MPRISKPRKETKDQQIAQLQEQLKAQIEVARLAQENVETLEGRVASAEALLKEDGTQEDAHRLRIAKLLFGDNCFKTASWDDVAQEISNKLKVAEEQDKYLRQQAEAHDLVTDKKCTQDVIEDICSALKEAEEEKEKLESQRDEAQQTTADVRESAIYLLQEFGIDTYAFVDADFDDTNAILKTKALSRAKVPTKTHGRRTSSAQLRLA